MFIFPQRDRRKTGISYLGGTMTVKKTGVYISPDR